MQISVLKQICTDYKILLKSIDKQQGNEQIGYLLGLKGFKPNKVKEIEGNDAIIYFYGLNQQQVFILVDLLKKKGISIPLKAMNTKQNIHFTVNMLIKHLKEENEYYKKG